MMRRILLALCLTLVASAPAWAAPDIQRWRTDDGTRVVFAATHELPIVDVRVLFDAGSARDGEHPGLARLTANLLLEGADGLSAGGIARRFEQQGARVSTGSARDSAWVSLRSLARDDNLGAATDLLARVLAAPDFPETAFERVRGQMQVALRHGRQDPGTVAGRAFMKALLGDHPYASPPDGTEAGLKGVTRRQVEAFHRRYYVAGNATVAIVGDIDTARAREIAAHLADGLADGEAAPALPPVPPLKASRTVRIPFDTSQTHVLIGETTPAARGDERWPALYLANHVLGGGGLVSVLAERMREQRGLSYSSSSSVTAAAAGGWFQVGTQVRNDRLDDALKVLRESIDEFRSKGPDADRLALARSNITGSFPLSLDSNRDLVGYLGMIGLYGLPTDYLARFPQRIDALGRERVAEVVSQVLSPGHRVTVLVGPAGVIGADTAGDADGEDGGGA
ncbi:putative zinc protease [wastewater metagenome]|uniref:Putative zinc protease n=2 Tax=unclassified sequences TaxID=12908 RepID=A0A5B8RJ73_9ZZZZ|nr:pitrilysin family protein [Arhodomonas sp. KWT]QEA07115.1 putative zinc protease [uncultured organism]